MAATADDVLQAIAALTKAIMEGHTATNAATTEARERQEMSRETRKKLEIRNMKITEFDGDKEKWDEWSHNFASGIRAQNSEIYKEMLKAEESAEDVDEESKDPRISAMSNELYDILAQTCKGKAHTMVRTVEDCGGLRAWQKLYQAGNPRTMATSIQLLGEVTRPPQVKNIADVEASIDRWEKSLQKIRKEHEEELSKTMKIAVFTNFMPTSIQEYIYVNVNKSTKYEEIMEKVKVLVRNKVGATAMDVGQLQEVPPGLQTWEDEWTEVGAIGHVQCHNCGKFGHFARDCFMKGKGGKGGGKDFGKGAQKGFGGKDYGKGNFNVKGYGGYGKGYSKGYDGGGGKANGKGYGGEAYGGKGGYPGKGGYQGTCFGCGEVGHKRAECTKAANVGSIDEWGGQQGETQHVEETTKVIESVWMIGNVNIEKDEKEWETIKRQKMKQVKTWKKVNLFEKDERQINFESNNHFEALKEFSKDHFATVKQMEQVPICNISVGEKLTRQAAMDFNEAEVQRPLASAACVTASGNGIWMDSTGGYIQNLTTGEKMSVRVENKTYVYDVMMEDGAMQTMTLDSGAGCNVWPRGLKAGLSFLRPKKAGVAMVAANGSPIEHYGQRLVKFQGVVPNEGFARRG